MVGGLWSSGVVLGRWGRTLLEGVAAGVEWRNGCCLIYSRRNFRCEGARETTCMGLALSALVVLT